MMSGSASAHLPTIIWLSSVAVFSAPFTDNPTERREARQAKLSSLQPTVDFLFFVFCHIKTNKCNFFFSSEGNNKS